MLNLQSRAAARQRWMVDWGSGGLLKDLKGGRANVRKSAGKRCWTALRSILITTEGEWLPLISNNSGWRAERGTWRPRWKEILLSSLSLSVLASLLVPWTFSLSFFLMRRWEDLLHLNGNVLPSSAYCSPRGSQLWSYFLCMRACVRALHTILGELDWSKSISQRLLNVFALMACHFISLLMKL